MKNNIKKIFLFCFFLLFLSGCGTISGFLDKTPTINPEGNNIYSVDKGVICGDKTTPSLGWYVSDYWMEEIAKIRANR